MANPRSLLSRIAPLESDMSSPIPVLAKRTTTEEEDARPAKRRALIHDDHAGQEVGFAPWLEARSSLEADGTRERRLHNELLQFVEYISPSKQEREAHRLLVCQIEALLKTCWLDAQVTIFGSSATGLELTGGDIDLVVSFETAPVLSESERKRRLTAMGNILRRSGMTRWVNRIFGARVPIITFATTEDLGEVSIDISIRNDEDSGVRAIPLVKQFLADMPALRPLVLAVKAFLSLRELNDASQGTLSSYAITLMCISFIQRNPTRRPQDQLDDPFTETSLGILLMDFFRHYGHDFSYATHYISVSERGAFPKKLKNWEQKANNPAVLAIQCILNPENNITRGCANIALIVEAFKEAFHILQNSSLETSSENASLLCHIYEVSTEDDARRDLLDQSVDSGVFSRCASLCTVRAGANAVSGGVPLAIPSGPHRDTKHNRTRLGAGQASIPRQLPVLRWQGDRSQQQPRPCLPNVQFEFQYPSGHFQDMQFMPQQIYPSQHFIPNQRYQNYSNSSYVNYGRLASQQRNHNIARSYHGRY